MANLAKVVRKLRVERSRTATQLAQLDKAIAVLRQLTTGNGRVVVAKRNGRKRRTMSAAARRRISIAQKARWAKVRRAEGPRPVRTMSQAGRNRIAAAQRARWAKWKEKQLKKAA